MAISFFIGYCFFEFIIVNPHPEPRFCEKHFSGVWTRLFVYDFNIFIVDYIT